MDWGSARPFAVIWFAVSDGSLAEFPRGALIAYREYYGMAPNQPNVGLKMTAEEVGLAIKAQEQEGETIGDGVLDPAAFAEDGGPSIAERIYCASGIRFRHADNKRVGANGAMGGWDSLRARLKGEDERAMLYFFSTCVHSIRTIPLLQHDTGRPEDVDTDGEDHAADAVRYGCMSRPYIARAVAKPREAIFLHEATADDVFWGDLKPGAFRRERL
jgi:hypothetical protein